LGKKARARRRSACITLAVLPKGCYSCCPFYCFFWVLQQIKKKNSKINA
jgi:hypothetical protein